MPSELKRCRRKQYDVWICKPPVGTYVINKARYYGDVMLSKWAFLKSEIEAMKQTDNDFHILKDAYEDKYHSPMSMTTQRDFVVCGTRGEFYIVDAKTILEEYEVLLKDGNYGKLNSSYLDKNGLMHWRRGRRIVKPAAEYAQCFEIKNYTNGTAVLKSGRRVPVNGDNLILGHGLGDFVIYDAVDVHNGKVVGKPREIILGTIFSDIYNNQGWDGWLPRKDGYSGIRKPKEIFGGQVDIVTDPELQFIYNNLDMALKSGNYSRYMQRKGKYEKELYRLVDKETYNKLLSAGRADGCVLYDVIHLEYKDGKIVVKSADISDGVTAAVLISKVDAAQVNLKVVFRDESNAKYVDGMTKNSGWFLENINFIVDLTLGILNCMRSNFSSSFITPRYPKQYLIDAIQDYTDSDKYGAMARAFKNFMKVKPSSPQNLMQLKVAFDSNEIDKLLQLVEIYEYLSECYCWDIVIFRSSKFYKGKFTQKEIQNYLTAYNREYNRTHGVAVLGDSAKLRQEDLALVNERRMYNCHNEAVHLNADKNITSWSSIPEISTNFGSTTCVARVDMAEALFINLISAYRDREFEVLLNAGYDFYEDERLGSTVCENNQKYHNHNYRLVQLVRSDTSYFKILRDSIDTTNKLLKKIIDIPAPLQGYYIDGVTEGNVTFKSYLSCQYDDSLFFEVYPYVSNNNVLTIDVVAESNKSKHIADDTFKGNNADALIFQLATYMNKLVQTRIEEAQTLNDKPLKRVKNNAAISAVFMFSRKVAADRYQIISQKIDNATNFEDVTSSNKKESKPYMATIMLRAVTPDLKDDTLVVSLEYTYDDTMTLNAWLLSNKLNVTTSKRENFSANVEQYIDEMWEFVKTAFVLNPYRKIMQALRQYAFLAKARDIQDIDERTIEITLEDEILRFRVVNLVGDIADIRAKSKGMGIIAKATVSCRNSVQDMVKEILNNLVI